MRSSLWGIDHQAYVYHFGRNRIRNNMADSMAHKGEVCLSTRREMTVYLRMNDLVDLL